jgi:hypothetical protein
MAVLRIVVPRVLLARELNDIDFAGKCNWLAR